MIWRSFMQFLNQMSKGFEVANKVGEWPNATLPNSEGFISHKK